MHGYILLTCYFAYIAGCTDTLVSALWSVEVEPLNDQ